MTTLKTEAVSVRVEPRIKAANMVEVMVVAYCRANAYPLVGVPDETLLAAKLGQSSL